MAARLELLAVELTSFIDNPNWAERKRLLTSLIAHARDDGYNRQRLIRELEDNGLRFFANKLRVGYYEDESNFASEQQKDEV